MANKITSVTRRNIFDYIRIENIAWWGRLEESEFLSRIFDIGRMPSHDSRFNSMSGDIWQHRINNPNDWPNDWVFTDTRLDLLNCDDAIFLNFLCEMVHPVVRGDASEVSRICQMFNDNLKIDGFEIVERSRISDRPIFVGRMLILGKSSIVRQTTELKKMLSEEYVTQQITLMESSIDNSPHIAIGVAKELIETCCKSIFLERQQPVDKNWDLLKLMKETTKLLKLTPDDIPNEAKAASSIKQILASFGSIVQGIGELRNEYGSGHGKDGNFKGLQPRHAKLAVGAASTLAIFLLETHKIRS